MPAVTELGMQGTWTKEAWNDFKTHTGAEGKSQSIKCLLYKHGGLSLVLQNPCKRPGVTGWVVHACNPSLGGMEGKQVDP